MKRYDYKCPKCGKIEEKKHSMNDYPEYKCPECGEIMKKLPSTGVTIKWNFNGVQNTFTN